MKHTHTHTRTHTHTHTHTHTIVCAQITRTDNVSRARVMNTILFFGNL